MTRADIKTLAKELRELLGRIDQLPEGISAQATKKLRLELEDVAVDLQQRLYGLDPIKQPSSIFDPADPRLFGTFAAVALIGQDLVPLTSVANTRFYGSGIYAIYYAGPSKDYQEIAGTETPIYVGKADPADGGAKSPKAQGPQLSHRLNEHRKNIENAENLNIDDFHCRLLVVASGWQIAAEAALIGLFRPVWNKETKILHGFGKHGDSGETRRNKRSPWDVLHPGRGWAKTGDVEDKKTVDQIRADITKHYSKHPAIKDLHQVLHDLLARMRGA